MYRLVIADDEDAVRSQLRSEIAWEKYGFRLCGEAASGAQAIAMVESLHPHLLITDIKMDDISGLSVLEKVRTAYPSTQVVILSAYNLFEYAQQAILHSAAGFLTKPIERDHLEQVLSKVIALLQSGDSIVQRDSAALAREYMRKHYTQKLTLEQVAEACFVHPTHLSRQFRKQYNITFSDYLTELRLERAAELLRMSEYRVREIAEKVGYDDYSYFCRVFRKAKGVTPLEYRCNTGGGI